VIMEKKESVFEKIGEASDRKGPLDDLTISDVLWPLITLSVLVLLLIFVYIPFGLEIPSLAEETAAVEEKVSKRQDKITTLNSINNATLDETHTLLSSALPARFDVSVLASAVTNLATINNLQQNDLTLSDEPAAGFQTIEQEGEIKGLKSLNGVFSFRGELTDVNAFIDAMVTSSRIISIEEFELKAVPVQNERGQYQRDEWNIDLSVKAYSFGDFTQTTVSEPAGKLPDLKVVKDLLGVE
jgi:Tfp pilus assembly protein PilO